MGKKEEKKSIDIASIAKVLSSVVTSEKGQSFICGTYSDGEPRSVIDAVRDEYISPGDRARWDKKKRKKKKQQEKHKKSSGKKKKHKKKKSDQEIFTAILRNM